MKKRLILKFVLNVLLIVSIVFAIIEGVDSSKCVHIFGDGSKLVEEFFIKRAFAFFFSALMQIVFLVLLDFTGVKFLFSSVLKEHKENKKALEEAKKQKKIEELENKLNSLKKNER